MRAYIGDSQDIRCIITLAELEQLKECGNDFYANSLRASLTTNFFYLGHSIDTRFANVSKQNGVQVSVPTTSPRDPYVCNLTDEGWEHLKSYRELSLRYTEGFKLNISVEQEEG